MNPSLDKEAESQHTPPTTDTEDHVNRTIKAFAITERRSNFYFLGRYSHKYTIDCILKISPADQKRINDYVKALKLDPSSFTGCTWYIFFQPIFGLEDIVPIRSGPQNDTSGEPTLDGMMAMHIEDTKSWMPFHDWMRKRFEWHSKCDWTQRGGAQLQLENQAIWWNYNGKHFKLMDLPLEVRELIYVEILGGGTILPRVRRNHVTLGCGHTVRSKSRAGSKIDPDIEGPNTPFLRTSRQVYQEATDAVWREATKRFNWKFDFTWSKILDVQRFGHPKALTRIQLELPALLFFELIGIQTLPRMPFRSITPGTNAVTIALLKSLQTIQSVDFRFISPNHPDAVDPWTLNLLRVTSSGHSCQKVWIHWFFILCFEQLRDWTYTNRNEKNEMVTRKTKITMSGCIKTSTRQEWEAIFANEGTMDPSGKRLSYAGDIEIAKRRIMATSPASLPIPCCCSVPCYAPETANDMYRQLMRYNSRPGLEEDIHERYFSFED